MIKCKCGLELGTWQFCPKCGSKAPKDTVCDCGTTLTNEWQYCSSCGKINPIYTKPTELPYTKAHISQLSNNEPVETIITTIPSNMLVDGYDPATGPLRIINRTIKTPDNIANSPLSGLACSRCSSRNTRKISGNSIICLNCNNFDHIQPL